MIRLDHEVFAPAELAYLRWLRAMSFRQGGHSEERRRRVLSDDRNSAAGAEGAEAARLRKGKSAKPGGYTAAAREENQLRITDLLPTKQRWLSLGLVGGFAGILGLEGLYGRSLDWAHQFGPAAAAPLDPTRYGTLAGWFASMLLGLTAILAIMVFNLRRHKEDDYRGRYRVWLWTAVLALLASLDASSGVHSTFSRAMVGLTGVKLYGDGSIWTLAVFGPIYAYIALRLFMEVWECSTAVTALSAAGLGYGVALANTSGLLTFYDVMLNTMLVSTCTLIAHLSLAYMSAQYARHVFLDAQGRLLRKARKKKAAKVAAKAAETTTSKDAAAAPATVRRTDLESPAASKSTAKPQPAASTPAHSRDEDDEEDSSSSGQNSLQRHLSKSERKRQARQQQFPQTQQRKAA